MGLLLLAAQLLTCPSHKLLRRAGNVKLLLVAVNVSLQQLKLLLAWVHEEHRVLLFNICCFLGQKPLGLGFYVGDLRSHILRFKVSVHDHDLVILQVGGLHLLELLVDLEKVQWLLVAALQACRELLVLLPNVFNVLKAVSLLHFLNQLLILANYVQLPGLLLRHFFRETQALNMLLAEVLAVAGPEVLHEWVHLAEPRDEVVDIFVLGIHVVAGEHVFVMAIHRDDRRPIHSQAAHQVDHLSVGQRIALVALALTIEKHALLIRRHELNYFLPF